MIKNWPQTYGCFDCVMETLNEGTVSMQFLEVPVQFKCTLLQRNWENHSYIRTADSANLKQKSSCTFHRISSRKEQGFSSCGSPPVSRSPGHFEWVVDICSKKLSCTFVLTSLFWLLFPLWLVSCHSEDAARVQYPPQLVSLHTAASERLSGNRSCWSNPRAPPS